MAPSCSLSALPQGFARIDASSADRRHETEQQTTNQRYGCREPKDRPIGSYFKRDGQVPGRNHADEYRSAPPRNCHSKSS